MTTQSPQPDQRGSDAQNTSPSTTGSKYNTVPYEPMDRYNTKVQRPRQVGILRNLTLVSLILYVVSAIPAVIVATDEALVEQTLREAGTLTQAQIDDMLDATVFTGMITTIVTTALAVILYLVVLFGIAKAKNWARTLGIVLAIIGGLLTLFGFVTSFGGLSAAPTLTIMSLVLGGVWLIVTIWWLVTAFGAPIRLYFATPPHERKS